MKTHALNRDRIDRWTPIRWGTYIIAGGIVVIIMAAVQVRRALDYWRL